MTDTEPDGDVEISDVATKALASMILEITAEAISDGPDVRPTALERLAEQSGLVFEVCAGVMLAVSTVMGAGNLDPQEVATMAYQLHADAVEESGEGTTT